MQLWGLRTCDTTRKALAALEGTGRDVGFTDVRESGIDADLAAELVARFGERTINRASTTWRNLDAEARDRPPAELLMQHPLLMKRPVISDGDDWTQGWNAAAQARWL